MNAILDRAMRQFAAISVEQFILMTVICATVYTLIEIVWIRKSGKELNMWNFISILSFIIYFNITLQLTLLGRKDGSRIGVELVPFQAIGSLSSSYGKLITTYSLLNVLLFVPYGFIMKWLPCFRKQEGLKSVILPSLLCLATSMFIEVAQLATGRGYYEVEDFICNTLGGIIGCLLFGIVSKSLKKIQEKLARQE